VSFIEGPGYRSKNLAIVLFPYPSGVNPEKILDNFWRVLEDTKKSGLSEREVELAKTLILRQGADIFENKLQLAEWIGESSLLYGSPWEPVKIIKKLLELSPQSINSCLQSVFHKKNSLVIVSN
jgi:predicted Zn-dependent peptidase